MSDEGGSDALPGAVFDRHPLPTFLVSIDGTEFLDANDAAVREYGYSHEEFLELDPVELRPPARMDEFRESVDKAEEAVDGAFRQTVHRRKDGSDLWVDVSYSQVEIGGRRAFLVSVRNVTDRHRARRRLARREVEYRSLFEQSVAGVYETTPGGRVEKANDGLARMFGYESGEALEGGDATRFYESPAEREAWLEKLRSDGSIPGHLVERVDESGDTMWLLESATLATDPETGEERILGTMIDVTGRRRVLESLRASEARYRSLFEQSRDAVFVTDMEGYFVEFNPAMQALLGHTSGELEAVRLAELFAEPEGARRFERAMAERGAVEDFPVTLEAAGGEEIECVLSAVRRHALDAMDGGEVLGYQGILRDVTERRERERELKKLSSVVEQAAEHVMITDRDGVIEYVNPAFTELTGYSQEELIGRSADSLRSGNRTDRDTEDAWAVALAGETFRGTQVSRKKNSEFFVEEKTVRPLRDENGDITHIVSTGRDVTKREELEEHLRRARKMEAMGQLAGGLAHDFNNLLTAIIGNAEFLEKAVDGAGDAPPAREAAQESVSEILRTARTAAMLTQELLTFAGRDERESEAVDPNRIVEELAGLLDRLLPDDILIHESLDPALGAVSANPARFEQVLLNLAVNARDAMEESDGGRLTIETADVRAPSEETELPAGIDPGRYVRLTVRDTGVGMKPETVERIFDPFFTTKPATGTGLGLATVYGIVKNAGGEVKVSSRPGVGTRFDVYWPAMESPAGALEPPEEEETEIEGGDERILLVEDDRAVRKLARLVLERAGYEPVVVDEGEEALAVARGLDGTIDCLVTDVVMPGTGGVRLARAIEEEVGRIPVLYMSGYADRELSDEALAPPWVGFLKKPFTAEELCSNLRRLLDREADAAPGEEAGTAEPGTGTRDRTGSADGGPAPRTDRLPPRERGEREDAAR